MNDFTTGLAERDGDCRYAHIFQNKNPVDYFSEVITGSLSRKLEAGNYDFSMWMAKAKSAKNVNNKLEIYLANNTCVDEPLIFSSGNVQNPSWVNGKSSFTITTSQANTYDHIRARLVKVATVDHEQDMLVDEFSIQKQQPPDCSKIVQWYDGEQVQPVYDGANCFVKEAPCCSEPFIYQNTYYIKAIERPKCDLGGFDGANCFVMKKPTGGFIFSNGFYAASSSGSNCPAGSTYDGANCFFRKAPTNTKAFEYKGRYYTTPLNELKCCFGKFDGANCKMGKAPSNRTPFIFNNNFYYY